MKREATTKPNSLKHIQSINDLDRFIPSKKSFKTIEMNMQTNLEFSPQLNNNENINKNKNDREVINDFLKHELFKNDTSKYFDPLEEKKLFSQEFLPGYIKNRKISDEPFKVLDAPMLQDDFYLNVLDWSNRNILGVGLGNSVYTLNFLNNKVTKLMDFGTTDYVTAINWNNYGNQIIIGSSKGKVLVLDVEKSI